MQLKHARTAFGDRHPDGLNKVELEDWREQLPAGSRHDVFRAFRQALSWAVERDLATSNSSNGIRNPKRKRHERREVLPLETWADVESVADELDQRYRAIPFVAVGCGLRPGTPALRAAGIPHRRLYDCRHTFATWAIEGGIELWYLARVMGTNVVQIEDTYARWLKRTDDQLRGAVDAYDVAAGG